MYNKVELKSLQFWASVNVYAPRLNTRNLWFHATHVPGKGERREARTPNRQRPQRSAFNQRRQAERAVGAASAVAVPAPVVAPDEDCDMCNMRHVEQCSWPQCNHSCPRLHNPITGELITGDDFFSFFYNVIISYFLQRRNDTKPSQSISKRIWSSSNVAFV